MAHRKWKEIKQQPSMLPAEVAECTTNAAGENSAVGGLLSRWRCTTVAAIEESPVGQSIN